MTSVRCSLIGAPQETAVIVIVQEAEGSRSDTTQLVLPQKVMTSFSPGLHNSSG